jgi:hypothetical protein
MGELICLNWIRGAHQPPPNYRPNPPLFQADLDFRGCFFTVNRN